MFVSLEEYFDETFDEVKDQSPLEGEMNYYMKRIHNVGPISS